MCLKEVLSVGEVIGLNPDEDILGKHVFLQLEGGAFSFFLGGYLIDVVLSFCFCELVLHSIILLALVLLILNNQEHFLDLVG